MLQGKIIEHKNGVATEYGPGTSFSADKDTVHWIENKGPCRRLLIVTTIIKQE